MSKTETEVPLRLRAHVYHYLRSTVGEKMILSPASPLGVFIQSMLFSPPTASPKTCPGVNYSRELPIVVRPWEYAHLYRTDLTFSQPAIDWINIFLDRQIKQECRTWVSISTHCSGITQQEAVERFFEKYGISEDDYSLETMIRNLRRLDARGDIPAIQWRITGYAHAINHAKRAG